MEESIEGCSAEILADYNTGKVVTRYLDPETGEMVMEIHLEPEVAREYAFMLTSSSIAIEEYQR